MEPVRASRRLLVIAAVALALIAARAQRPVFGAMPPNQGDPALQAPAASTPAAAGCALRLAPQPAMSLLTPAGALPQSSSPLAGAGATWHQFTGYCPCGCSVVRDCNTSADCYGGAPCMRAPSCC
jgi:hypothetical protein